jgi:hypothetical protein
MEKLSEFFISLGFEEESELLDNYYKSSSFRHESFYVRIKYYNNRGAIDLYIFDSLGESKYIFFSENLLREFILTKKHEYEECRFNNFLQEVEKTTYIEKYCTVYGLINDVRIKDNNGETLLRIHTKPNFLLEVILVHYRVSDYYPPSINTISSKDNVLLSELKRRIDNYLVDSNENAFEGFLYEKGANISIYP